MSIEEMKQTADKETARIEELIFEIREIYERLHKMCNAEYENVPYTNDELKELEQNGTEEEINRAYDENAKWFKGFDELREAERFAYESMR